MGQHKHNPTAIAAAKGELPPKPKRLGKREAERLLQSALVAKLCEVNPSVNTILSEMQKYY